MTDTDIIDIFADVVKKIPEELEVIYTDSKGAKKVIRIYRSTLYLEVASMLRTCWTQPQSPIILHLQSFH